MNRIKIMREVALRACPICGKDDKLEVESKEFFDIVCAKHGDALLKMECKRCNLALSVYPMDFEDKTYNTMLTALVEKWNTREDF